MNNSKYVDAGEIMIMVGAFGVTALYGLILNKSLIEKSIEKKEKNIKNLEKKDSILHLDGWLELEAYLDIRSNKNAIDNTIVSLNNSKNESLQITIITVLVILSYIMIIIGEILILIEDDGINNKIEDSIKSLMIGGCSGSIVAILETVYIKNNSNLRGASMGLGTCLSGISVLEVLNNI